MMIKLSKLFEVKLGDAPSFDEYVDITDETHPTVAYVSASTTRNGINGFVVPHRDNTVFSKNLVTVAVQGQGSVAFATLQPHEFVASKLVAVLTPKPKGFDTNGITLNNENLSIICSLIRKQRWRFSFGRTVSTDRLKMLVIDVGKVKTIASILSLNNSAEVIDLLNSVEEAVKSAENGRVRFFVCEAV